jgi:hypothetical protein
MTLKTQLMKKSIFLLLILAFASFTSNDFNHFRKNKYRERNNQYKGESFLTRNQVKCWRDFSENITIKYDGL